MLSAILFPSLASSFRFRAKSNCHLRQVIKKPTPKIRKSMPKSHVLLAIDFANLLMNIVAFRTTGHAKLSTAVNTATGLLGDLPVVRAGTREELAGYRKLLTLFAGRDCVSAPAPMSTPIPSLSSCCHPANQSPAPGCCNVPLKQTSNFASLRSFPPGIT